MGEHKNVRQYSDQYHCSSCGRQWDVNDPDPPPCQRESQAGEKAMREIRRALRDHGKR